MCWNAEVSLNTFLFSLVGVLLAYFTKVINFVKSLFFLSFISMQLLEYFTWNNLNDKVINAFLSKIGLFLIFIQIPLFILSQHAIKRELKLASMIAYLTFAISALYYYPIDFSMTKAPNGHLAWNWLQFPTYIVFLWFSFALGLILYQKKYITFITYFLIFFAIYYTYYSTNTWGSLWCWISNALSLKLIFQSISPYRNIVLGSGI